MEGQEIRGLMEAYSQVYDTPEVLNEEIVEEDVEQLMERGAPTDPKARAAYDAQVAKNRSALGNTLLYGNAAGKKPEAPVTRNRNVRGGGTIKPSTAAAPAKPKVSNIPPSEGTGKGGPSDIRKSSTPTSSTPVTKPTAADAPTKPAATSTPKPTTPAAPAKPAPGTKAAGPESIKPKTPNPLMQKTFGYQTGNAPDQIAKASAGVSKEKSDAAFAKTKEDIKTKLKPSADLKMSLDLFDLVKGHLLDEGYADTEEGAMVIMVNMSEEWRKSILESHGVEIYDEELELGEGMSMKDFKANRKKNERKEASADARSRGHEEPSTGRTYSADEARSRRSGIHNPEKKPSRDAARDAAGGETGHGGPLRAKKVRKARAMGEISEAQRARENPEDHDKEEKRKYEPVRGERTPMPPRGDKRREDFEKWYAKHVR